MALTLRKLLSDQHFTKPPPRFTEGTLVKELEEKGIGRPSTYASILSTIQEKQYVQKGEGRFKPTELGVLVTDLLVRSFPDILNVEFTAQMEDRLDGVEDGRVPWRDLLHEFYRPFVADLDRAQGEMRNVKREEIPTDFACEKCGKPMVVRWGRNGSFLACSGYPECRNTKEISRSLEGDIEVIEDEQTDEKCPVCAAAMVVKRGRYGRFLACTRYPECKTSRPISTGVACPREGCGGALVERRSKRGKLFYGCDRYPECSVVMWDRPVAEPCTACAYPVVTEREGRRGATQRKCPKCGFTTAWEGRAATARRAPDEAQPEVIAR
jgi:DNA topoisomerase-1